MDQIYDVIIIGGGAAATSAVLTLKNRGKTAAIVSNKEETSSLYKAEKITNYPGLPAMTGAEILRILSELSVGTDVALVMVTHSPDAAAICDRVLTLENGVLK